MTSTAAWIWAAAGPRSLGLGWQVSGVSHIIIIIIIITQHAQQSHGAAV
jgi:hypothetical protein